MPVRADKDFGPRPGCPDLEQVRPASGGEVGNQGEDAEDEEHQPAHEYPQPGHDVDTTLGNGTDPATTLPPAAPKEGVKAESQSD